MLCFLSLSFDMVTTATTTNAAPADHAEAPEKYSSKEEVADETAAGNGLFHKRRTEEVEQVALLIINNITQKTSITNRQIKINLILKKNLILFYSISTSAAQRQTFSFAMSAITAQAKIRAMVNPRSDQCSLFEEFLTKYDNILAYFPQLLQVVGTQIETRGSMRTNKNRVLTRLQQEIPRRINSNVQSDLIPKKPKIGKIVKGSTLRAWRQRLLLGRGRHRQPSLYSPLGHRNTKATANQKVGEKRNSQRGAAGDFQLLEKDS